MLRLCLMIIVAFACIGAGATAGLAAFASEFNWPLSEPNFEYSARLGAYCGAFGALIAAACLFVVKRKYIWVVVALSIIGTWIITCAGVWCHVISVP